jgi:hypothetical protein
MGSAGECWGGVGVAPSLAHQHRYRHTSIVTGTPASSQAHQHRHRHTSIVTGTPASPREPVSRVTCHVSYLPPRVPEPTLNGACSLCVIAQRNAARPRMKVERGAWRRGEGEGEGTQEVAARFARPGGKVCCEYAPLPRVLHICVVSSAQERRMPMSSRR